MDGRFGCSLLVAEVIVAEVDDSYDGEEAIALVASRFEELLSSDDGVVPGS